MLNYAFLYQETFKIKSELRNLSLSHEKDKRGKTHATAKSNKVFKKKRSLKKNIDMISMLTC